MLCLRVESTVVFILYVVEIQSEYLGVRSIGEETPILLISNNTLNKSWIRSMPH